MNRRFFLLAAPAIVAAPSLMRVSALVMPEPTLSFSELVTATLRNNPQTFFENMERNRLIAEYVQSMSGITDLMRGAQSA